MHPDSALNPKPETYQEEQEEQEKPQPPWARFAALWACSSLACGLLPGQSLFVEMFADSGVFMSSCADGKTGCTDQVLFLTSIFGAGQSLAYGFSAPIGLLFDRWGPNVTGVVGAILCAIGLLMVSGSAAWLCCWNLHVGFGAVSLGLQASYEFFLRPSFLTGSYSNLKI